VCQLVDYLISDNVGLDHEINIIQLEGVVPGDLRRYLTLFSLIINGQLYIVFTVRQSKALDILSRHWARKKLKYLACYIDLIDTLLAIEDIKTRRNATEPNILWSEIYNTRELTYGQLRHNWQWSTLTYYTFSSLPPVLWDSKKGITAKLREALGHARASSSRRLIPQYYPFVDGSSCYDLPIDGRAIGSFKQSTIQYLIYLRNRFSNGSSSFIFHRKVVCSIASNLKEKITS
jgi:hypothetical protein